MVAGRSKGESSWGGANTCRCMYGMEFRGGGTSDGSWYANTFGIGPRSGEYLFGRYGSNYGGICRQRQTSLGIYQGQKPLWRGSAAGDDGKQHSGKYPQRQNRIGKCGGGRSDGRTQRRGGGRSDGVRTGGERGQQQPRGGRHMVAGRSKGESSWGGASWRKHGSMVPWTPMVGGASMAGRSTGQCRMAEEGSMEPRSMEVRAVGPTTLEGTTAVAVLRQWCSGRSESHRGRGAETNSSAKNKCACVQKLQSSLSAPPAASAVFLGQKRGKPLN